MKRILIVDDEPHVRRVLQLSLERAGYAVHIEFDGQAGLERALKDPPDALVSDINMPRMTGREMVQALHAALPERTFPILVMTSLTAREERAWVRAIPNVDFLEKPLSPRELVTRLARLFDAEQAHATEASVLDRLLAEVDFDRHHRWLTRAAGPATPLAACGADGAALWVSTGEPGAALAASLQTLGSTGFDAPFEGGGMNSRPLADGSRLLYRPIDGSSGQRIGWLATRAAGFSADAAPIALDALAEALEDLGAAVADDCRIRFELHGMTEELSERYEELHLVYGADRHVREHTRELEVFQALLGNCAAQMDVDVVAFLRPGENLCLSATELSRPIHNLDLVLVEMRGDLFRFVQSTRETVVLNEPDDPRRAYVFTDMPYRVMACPVRRKGTIDSQLVLLNHANKQPFSNSDRRLAEVLANQLSSLGQTYTLMDQLARFNQQLAAALIEAVEAKDPYTRGHSERVHHISMEIGRAMGLPADDLEDLHWGSLLHDVGKIGIPDAVLCKPGRLDRDEYAFIMVHPERSYEILRHVDYLKGAVLGARHHQEMWDGSGYPHGLKGARIPLLARIVAVADTYDSITSSRAYRAGRSHEIAMREIQRVSGKQLDPAVVEVLVEICAAEPEWLKRFSISRDPKPAPPPAVPQPQHDRA